MDPNVSAFLATIRASEGTGNFPDPYAVTFGEKFTLTDFSNHPHALGWKGFPWKGIWETAAGAYQINYPTFLTLVNWGILDAFPEKFSPDAQDAMAVALIDRRAHALQAIETGEFDIAVSLCAPIWASLPGSTSGQPQARLADLKDIYAAQGGQLA